LTGRVRDRLSSSSTDRAGTFALTTSTSGAEPMNETGAKLFARS
jgi:hypothetical protein